MPRQEARGVKALDLAGGETHSEPVNLSADYAKVFDFGGVCEIWFR